jgi:hypothetical protein
MKHHKDHTMSVMFLFADRHLLVAMSCWPASSFAFDLVSSSINLPKQNPITVLKEFMQKLLSDFHSSPKKNPLSIRSTSTNTQGAASGLELSRSGTPKF